MTIALVICTCNGVKAPSITGRKDSPRLGRQESGAAAGILWPLRPPNESVDCPTDSSAYVCSMYDVRRRDIHFLFATWAPLSGTLLADPGSWLCSRECNTLHSHVARLTTTQIFKSCNRSQAASGQPAAVDRTVLLARRLLEFVSETTDQKEDPDRR